MERIYEQAKDQNVAAFVIYGKASDTKAYVDSACTEQFKTSGLQDAFLKRAVIKIGTAYYIPTGFTVTGKVGSVSYVTTTGSSSDIKTVVSTLAAAAD